jgi:hypothetical protein
MEPTSPEEMMGFHPRTNNTISKIIAAGAAAVLILCWAGPLSADSESQCVFDLGGGEFFCQLKVDSAICEVFAPYFEKQCEDQTQLAPPLQHNTVILVRDCGEYVSSRVRYRLDPLTMAEVRYVTGDGDELFSLHVEAESRVSVDSARTSIEPILRRFLISLGYQPISGYDFGPLNGAKLKTTERGLILAFEIDGSHYEYLLQPPESVQTEDSICPAGVITRAGAGDGWVVVQFERPYVQTDWEGGFEDCRIEIASARVRLTDPPVVEHDGRIIDPLKLP